MNCTILNVWIASAGPAPVSTETSSRQISPWSKGKILGGSKIWVWVGIQGEEKMEGTQLGEGIATG